MKRVIPLVIVFVFVSLLSSQYVEAADCLPLNRDLRTGATGPDVLALQQYLNKTPATQIAATGSGSPGNESQYFGVLTAQAVARWQGQHGLPTSGLFGPMSRAKYTELCLAQLGLQPINTPVAPVVPGTQTQTPVTQTNASTQSAVPAIPTTAARTVNEKISRTIEAGKSVSEVLKSPKHGSKKYVAATQLPSGAKYTESTRKFEWSTDSSTRLGTYVMAFSVVEGDTQYVLQYEITVRQKPVSSSSASSTSSTQTPVITVTCTATPTPQPGALKVKWQAMPSGGNGTFSYSWTGTDSLSGSSSAVEKTYTTTGEKKAQVKVTSGNRAHTQYCNPVYITGFPLTR